MIVIKSLSDLNILSNVQGIEEMIKFFLKKYYNQFGGKIVYLQDYYDCMDLSAVGLSTCYSDCYPEIVKIIELKKEYKSLLLYKSTILINNEMAVDIFSKKGKLSSKDEKFLMNECSSYEEVIL